MRIKQLMDELDKLRRYAGSDVPVLVRILLEEQDESKLLAVRAVIRERDGKDVRIVLEV